MPNREATIVSGRGRYKVEIKRRADGLLEVTAYKWTEDIPGYGKVDEFWERIVGSASITDTFERAEQLAQEKLEPFECPPGC